MMIRRMTAADVDAAMELAAGLPAAPHWPRETYLAALDSAALPARITLVAEMPDSALAGFAVASLIPPQAELESIAVAAALQRGGVAQRLFATLAAELIAAGVNEVLLEVRASNEAALGLYRALGFELSGRRTGYYDHPTEDALLLRKALP